MALLHRVVGLVVTVALLAGVACAPTAAPSPTAVSTAAPAAKPAATPTEKPAPAAGADWKADWDKVVAAAKQEGKLVLYGPPGPAVRTALTDEFQKAYGIPVEFWGVAGGGELAARVTSERQAGQFVNDVFIFGATTLWGPLKKALSPQPLANSFIVPEVKDPKNWREIEYGDAEGKLVFSMQLDVGNMAAINTSMVKPEELKSFKDLLDPKWKGKFVVADPRIAGQGEYSLSAISDIMGEEFLVKLLKEQQPTISGNVQQITEWAARGRYAIVIGSGHTLIQPFVKEGLPILGISFSEGAYVSPGYYSLAIADKAPHPNAAKVYANWLLGKDAQTLVSIAAGKASARADVSTDHLPKLAVPVAGGRYYRPHLEKNEKINSRVKTIFDEIYGK